MRQKTILAATALCLAFIVYATLTRFGARPVLVGRYEALWIVALERFGAYAVLGVLLGCLLPRRLATACVLVVGAAILLELLQSLIPDRHPAIIDVVEKVVGAVSGVLLARIVPSGKIRQ
jgi:VanZ family protein